MIALIILILNILATLAEGQEGSLEIVVDSTSKQVSPGEDAVFYWTAYNNDTFTSYDLTVSCPGTELSDSSFTLEPGESRTVTQTASTSISDENVTYYMYPFRWDGTWHMFLTSGSIIPIEGCICVTVINNTGTINNTEAIQNTQNGTDDAKNGSSNHNTVPISVPDLLAIAILIIIFIISPIRIALKIRRAWHLVGKK